MKNLKKLCLLTLLIFTFSCSSENDGDSITEQNRANIIGTWLFTTSTTNGIEDTGFYICDYEETIEFNGTNLINKFYYDPSETNGSNCQLDETFSTTYNINDNIITIDDEDETYSAEITTLNDATFTFKETDAGEVFTITYTKQ